MRLPTKPWQLPTSTATLPIFLPICIEVAITDLSVFSPRTISSRRITLAGEKKCRPITLSGRLVEAAITSISRYEVFEARIAPGLAILSSLPKTSFLISISSNTASMIRSQSARSSRFIEGVSRPMRFSTSSWVRRPFLAVFS